MTKPTKKVTLNVDQLELLYNFIGAYEPELKEDYNQIPKFHRKFSFSQFCIVKFELWNTTLDNLKTKKND